MDRSCGFPRAYTNRDLRTTKLLNKGKPGFLHSQRIWWRTRGGKIESWIQVNTYGRGWRTKKAYIGHVVERARWRRIFSSYNGGSKNEAKRGEESWPTVASGSGPSLSKSSPPIVPHRTFSLHPVPRDSIQVCPSHFFFFLFLLWTRCPRSHFVLFLRPLLFLRSLFFSFLFTLFYSARSEFSLTFAIS